LAFDGLSCATPQPFTSLLGGKPNLDLSHDQFTWRPRAKTQTASRLDVAKPANTLVGIAIARRGKRNALPVITGFAEHSFWSTRGSSWND
jgi:hypothetical protein